MGEAFLQGHGGVRYQLSATFSPHNNVFIVGQPVNDGRLTVVATLGNTQVTLDPSECVITPAAVAANTTQITVTKTIGGMTRSVSLPITAVSASETFGDNSWATIAAVAYSGLASELWIPGDEKTDTIDGTQHTFRIIGFDINDLAEEDEYYSDAEYNKGKGKAALSLQFKTVAGNGKMYNSYMMRDTQGWKDTIMYKETLPALYSAFPQAMKNVIRLVNVLCYDGDVYAGNPGYEYVLHDRLTLIDPYIEAQSLRWLFDGYWIPEFFYHHLNLIGNYQLFRQDGYIGIGNDSGPYEWTRLLNWYNYEHGYDVYSIASSTNYYNPRFINNLPTVVKPYRPIFNI